MPRKLKCETNTAAMERRVLAAATEILSAGRRSVRLQTDFEHGQWWVTDLDTGAQWSVVDVAPGGNAVDGFDLEQVTSGDED